MARVGILMVLVGSLAVPVGCASGPVYDGPKAMMDDGSNAGVGKVELTPDYVGKRIRVVLKPGTRAITGKVTKVDPSSESATISTKYGSHINFRTTEVAILEELRDPEAPPPAPAGERAQRPAAPTRFTLAPRDDRKKADPVDTSRIELTFVDFSHSHKIKECLHDLGGPLREAPSTVMFRDETSEAVLKVEIPEDENASLIPYSWHGHVFYAAPDVENQRDHFLKQNTDGNVVISKDVLQGAQQVVLIGTPHLIKSELQGINAIAPPRMVAIDVVEGGKAVALLNQNPQIVHKVTTSLGDLYTASQSANDVEMILSTYDPTRRNATYMPDVRYSVHDGLLTPAWTLDVTDAAGKLWQRIGAYPIPQHLSYETADTTRVTLEVGPSKQGDFGAPALPNVRAPETALVKAELDIRYAGLKEGYAYKMLIAHGIPGDPENSAEKLYNPEEKDLDPANTYEAKTIDYSDAPTHIFPAQAFVWFQLSTQWKGTGGFMPGATPMKAPSSSKAPSRRLAHYPAAQPGTRFISFSGPQPSQASAALPAALGSRGIGGNTLGSGGPYVPFSPSIGTSMVIDQGRGGTAPAANALSSPAMVAMPISAASATAIAIANCSCGGGGGGGGHCEDEKKEGDKDKPGKTGTEGGSDRPKTPGETNGRPNVPTIDPFAPDIHPGGAFAPNVAKGMPIR